MPTKLKYATIAVLALLFVFTGYVCSILVSGPNFGGRRFSENELVELASGEGSRLVAAILDYKSERGDYPASLHAAFPEARENEWHDWVYERNDRGQSTPLLRRKLNWDDSLVYSFEGENKGWRALQGDGNVELPIPPPS